MELRYLTGTELRAAGNKIQGYAAVFGSPSADLGGFTEYIEPGAFSRAIRERQDVLCLFNHDRNYVLGRTASGTCRLLEDSTGLEFSCDIGTQQARDVRTMIDRGDVRGCSFSFAARKDQWGDGGKTRTLIDVNLGDVGPVAQPAYPATSVSARSASAGMTRTGVYEFRKLANSGVYTPALDLELEDLRRRDKARVLRLEILK